MYDKNKIKKKKLLQQLSNEVKEIEMKIKYNKIFNLKIVLLKYLKIILKYGQLLAPYIVSISLLASISKLLGFGFPFYEDNVNKKLGRIKEFDNLGNIKYEEFYGDMCEREYFKASKNIDILTHYGKWNKIKDNLYERTIMKYNLKNLTEEDIINLSNDPLYLENVLGKPIRIITEKRNNINETEINTEYVEAVTYSVIEDKFIYAKESFDLNTVNSYIYIILSVILCFIVYKIREHYSNFDITDEIADIKNRYKKQDLDILKKKLEIRKDNYNRLTEK